jgi:hypothetical protein
MSKNNHNKGESNNSMNNNSSSNSNKGKGKQKSDNNLKKHAGGRPEGKPNSPNAQKPGTKPRSEAPPPKDQRAIDNMQCFQKATKLADHEHVCVHCGMKNFNAVIYIAFTMQMRINACEYKLTFSLSLYKSNNNYNLRNTTGIESNKNNDADAGSSSAEDDIEIMDEVINCIKDQLPLY